MLVTVRLKGKVAPDITLAVVGSPDKVILELFVTVPVVAYVKLIGLMASPAFAYKMLVELAPDPTSELLPC